MASSVLTRLLQRTRASTFDPYVSQVYHTPIAHAVRGDFGGKRPLPSSWQATADVPAPRSHAGDLRYVTIQDIDDKHGMTNWKESEREPLFRKRWFEAGVRVSDKPRRDVLGVGVTGEDDVNATFGPPPRIVYDNATLEDTNKLTSNVVWGTHHGRFASSADVLPNYHAMDERTFQRFLSDIRRQRPKFRAALEQNRKNVAIHERMERLAHEAADRTVTQDEWDKAATYPQNSTGVDMWTEARLPHAPQSAADYLRNSAEARYNAPNSQVLATPAHAAPAHSLRGLQYAQPDNIYTYLLNEPIQGRALHRVEEARRNRYFMNTDASLTVAVGGHVGHLPLQYRNGLDTVDYTRVNPKRGESYFRVLHAWMDMAPTVANARRAPPRVDCEPELGSLRTQVMALRRPGVKNLYEAPPMPGSRRWIDDPDASHASAFGGNALRASSPEAGSLFGSLARKGRSGHMPRQDSRRQRLQKRKRDVPGSVQRDIQMLNNIKNLLSSQ